LVVVVVVVVLCEVLVFWSEVVALFWAALPLVLLGFVLSCAQIIKALSINSPTRIPIRFINSAPPWINRDGNPAPSLIWITDVTTGFTAEQELFIGGY
jgi:hypothetical protein